MKLLTLIVKPSKTELVKEALDASGIGGATILDASGSVSYTHLRAHET